MVPAGLPVLAAALVAVAAAVLQHRQELRTVRASG
jgi:hypothetical protein